MFKKSVAKDFDFLYEKYYKYKRFCDRFKKVKDFFIQNILLLKIK